MTPQEYADMKFSKELPKINWIKMDQEKHRYWTDGSRFLFALQVKNSVKKTVRWDFETLEISCDYDGVSLKTCEGEFYSSWNVEDFEYFYLIEGEMPTPKEPIDEK